MQGPRIFLFGPVCAILLLFLLYTVSPGTFTWIQDDSLASDYYKSILTPRTSTDVPVTTPPIPVSPTTAHVPTSSSSATTPPTPNKTDITPGSKARNCLKRYIDMLPFGLNCGAVLDNRETAAKLKGWATTAPNDAALLRLLKMGGCDAIRSQYCFPTEALTPEEAEFPLAYAMVGYKNLHQLTRFLSLLYWPQNLYCIAHDRKAAPEVGEYVKLLKGCFPNIVTPEEAVRIHWGTIGVLNASVNCLKVLDNNPNKWRYTNHREYNDVTGELKENTSYPKTIPFNLTIYKGSWSSTLSRAFVHWTVNDPIPVGYLAWLRDTYIPDEQYWSTLIHNDQDAVDLTKQPHLIAHKFYYPEFQPAGLLCVQVNLKLILVSGRTEEFLFAPTTSAAEIAQHVFDNWPPTWAEEAVESAAILKLIYHGRFLHGNVTLQALSLPLGKTTVMHLVARENLPEPNSQDNLKKSKAGGCCRCCSLS